MSRINHLILALISGLFCLFLLFQTVVSPVRAIDLTVLNTHDSGAGSLRQAIVLASDGDTILFDSNLNGQTIILTSGQLLITKNLTISGPGANLLAISGNNASRVFYITSTVTISGMTIKEGFAADGGGGVANGGGGIANSGTVNLLNITVSNNTSFLAPIPPPPSPSIGSAGFGGGIGNSGILNLINSTIADNTADSFGGGVYNVNGTVNLTSSTVSSNTASPGGGIYNFSGTVNLINSTVSSNTASGGGGIGNQGTVTLINSTVSSNFAKNYGGILNIGILNLTNSTVSSNTADSFAGGIYSHSNYNGATATLTNTILSNNRASDTADDCTLYSGTLPSGSLTSGGYNLVQATNNCVFSATGDITNTNPLLGPLSNNGGDTLTHALLNGSPAIDYISNGTNGCGTTITTDQRGVTRPQGSGCDIGAYEAYELGYLYLPLIFSN